jgi:hypothetical protein
MAVLRSQNPSWSLIGGVDARFEKMKYGTKISTMSMHIGWAFWSPCLRQCPQNRMFIEQSEAASQVGPLHFFAHSSVEDDVRS